MNANAMEEHCFNNDFIKACFYQSSNSSIRVHFSDFFSHPIRGLLKFKDIILIVLAHYNLFFLWV